MITKVKTSVSLSKALLGEIALSNRYNNVSQFIEQAVTYYLAELKRQERGRCDIEIINANAARFNREAEENLAFQDML
jgi:metal-responsive CopG/Arc/MetJ family transcriptional regulator